MKDRVVIRLPQAELTSSTAVEWIMFDRLGQRIDSDVSNIDQLAERIPNLGDDADVTAIIPDEFVLLTQVSIPSTQMRQIKQALPFMVEELIADDIEDVHIAITEQFDPSQKIVNAAVVQHTLLINWLDVLLSHGISASCIAIDSLCLPFDPNTWTLLADGDRLLIRTDEYAGMAIAAEDFELVFNGLMEQLHVDNESSHIVIKPQFNIVSSAQQQSDQALCSTLVAYLQDNYPDHDVKESFYQESLTEIISTAWFNQPAKGINLLQGGYSVSENNVNSWQRWKLTASIAAVGIISYLLLTLGSGWYFSSQAKHYEQQSVTLYKQLFPNERRIVSPKKQMQNYLRISGTSTNTAFLALLAETAKQLGNQDSDLALSVNQLRFDSERGDLQFEVQSQSLDQLDQLKQQLANAGLQVDISSATEQDNIVMGRIVVRSL